MVAERFPALLRDTTYPKVATAQINLNVTQNSLVASTPQLRPRRVIRTQLVEAYIGDASSTPWLRQRRVIRTQLVEAYIGNEIIPSDAARFGLITAQNSSLAGWPRLRPLTALC